MTRVEVIHPESLRVLSAQVQRLQQEVRNTQRRGVAFRSEMSDGRPGFLAYTAAGITARAGTTPGTGTVQPKRLSSNSSAIIDDGDTMDVYSWAPTASSTGVYVWVTYDRYEIPWWTEEGCT